MADQSHITHHQPHSCVGALTVSDMEALFNPAPFGENGQVSPFVQAAMPNILPVWDLFRNIDLDKQTSLLQEWEKQVSRQQEKSTKEETSDYSGLPSGLKALKSWARVRRSAREALKRSRPALVESLELPILSFLHDSQGEGEDAVLRIGASGPYERLLLHGIADFHNLRSSTRSEEGKFTVRRSPSSSPASKSLCINCADIVFALASNPQVSLTARGLVSQWKRDHVGSDTGSESQYVLV